MQLKRLAGGCFDGTCPTLYETDRGTIVVQGHIVNDTDVSTTGAAKECDLSGD
jgi:hypothetical protein